MKVCWVKIWIASMATLTERFRDDEGRVDFEALGREEYAFRHALITGDYCKSERARDLAEAAEKDYKIHSENGKKGGRPKKLTADGDTREDSLNVTDGSNAALLESGASANNSGAGGKTPGIERTSESLPAPTPSKSEKESFGEFGNVKLTQIEYANLCQRVDNADTLIDELDQYIESQGKTKKYKSHYATLLNWSRRKAQEAEPKQGFKTAADRDREEIQKIADYYAAQERGEKPPMPKIQLVEGL